MGAPQVGEWMPVKISVRCERRKQQ